MSKNGFFRNKQRYKCGLCGRQFNAGQRLNDDDLWNQYVFHKQTYEQLAKKYSVHSRTIQRRLDRVNVEKSSVKVKSSIVVMDTTYFGRNFGVMVFKDFSTGQILFHQYVKWESLSGYLNGIEIIRLAGIKIEAIVCDGKRGLLQGIRDIPIQMCHFHQISIVTRYITRNPKIGASIELKQIMHLLPNTDKESFIGILNEWFFKWEDFLNERSIDIDTGKSRYTHRRLRSAYKSVKNNLLWLFTYYEKMELKIPNTTNCLEGIFTHIKNKLRNHNGLINWRKQKFIDEFLKAYKPLNN